MMGKRPTATTTAPTTATTTEVCSPGQQWTSWRWQLRHAVTSLDGLKEHLHLSESEVQGVARAIDRGLPLRLTPYLLSLCDPDDPGCPMRRQFIPCAAEGVPTAGDLDDPLGEVEHEVAPHLIRRYPDRALLITTASCAVHCRFCTRTRVVRSGGGAAPWDALQPAFSWLAQHPEVLELILSGGDPFIMSTARLRQLLERIRQIPSIGVIRVGTRVPGALPMRIDGDLVRLLREHQPLWVMAHFNHPRELSSHCCEALARLADGGIPVMSQTVLLRGINDDAGILAELFRGLVRHRVRPYYLLHGDVMAGTGHLRTSIERSIELYAQLQGKVSGIAVPKLMVDTPAGRGKVPIGPETVVHREPGRTILRTFRGELVEVLDPDGERLRKGQ